MRNFLVLYHKYLYNLLIILYGDQNNNIEEKAYSLRVI